jgi:hypothetical protein
MAGDVDRFELEISTLLTECGTGVTSASRVINPLLQLWSIAQEIDPTVAAPIGQLLTALAHRALMTAQELELAIGESRTALAALATSTAAV